VLRPGVEARAQTQPWAERQPAMGGAVTRGPYRTTCLNTNWRLQSVPLEKEIQKGLNAGHLRLGWPKGFGELDSAIHRAWNWNA